MRTFSLLLLFALGLCLGAEAHAILDARASSAPAPSSSSFRPR